MNRRIEDYKATGMHPRIMILDGACLCRQMHHPNGDSYHFLSAHNDYERQRRTNGDLRGGRDVH
eukprot:4846965-Pyramimonas_sp.AAC.1